MTRRNDISVVIPTVGRTLLQQTLESILAGEEVPDAIIVVDQSANAEIDEWLEGCRQRGIDSRHIGSSQTGRAAGVNTGLRHVETAYCAITDDDCTVGRDWLTKIREHLTAHPERVLTGRVEAGGDESVPVVVNSMTPALYTRPRLKFDALCGGNMAMSMQALERVGLFDEDPALACSEDGEWAYRALRAGVALEYVPDIVVCHHGWRDASESERQYRQYALSHGGFYGKYLKRYDWFIALRMVAHYLRASRRFVRARLSGNIDESRLPLAYLRWLGPGVVAGLRTYRRIVQPNDHTQ